MMRELTLTRSAMSASESSKSGINSNVKEPNLLDLSQCVMVNQQRVEDLLVLSKNLNADHLHLRVPTDKNHLKVSSNQGRLNLSLNSNKKLQLLLLKSLKLDITHSLLIPSLLLQLCQHTLLSILWEWALQVVFQTQLILAK